MTVPLLHVLGGGRTARSITRVLFERGAVRVGQVCNRSLDSARKAVEFIGAGQPVESHNLGISDGWLMVGLPDGVIEGTIAVLAEGHTQRPQLAFHLSGLVSSKALEPLGCKVASVHPLKAFSDPERAAASFAGTWCAAEGEDSALVALRSVFERVDARWVEFTPRDKAAWHAATVAASNFLVTVNALARELATVAGMAEADAAGMLHDLQQGTLGNLTEQPAARALTGPFERGDLPACQRLHAAAHQGLTPDSAALFDRLALATQKLARSKRGDRPDDEELARLFAGGRPDSKR